MAINMLKTYSKTYSMYYYYYYYYNICYNKYATTSLRTHKMTPLAKATPFSLRCLKVVFNSNRSRTVVVSCNQCFSRVGLVFPHTCSSSSRLWLSAA